MTYVRMLFARHALIPKGADVSHLAELVRGEYSPSLVRRRLTGLYGMFVAQSPNRNEGSS